MNSNLNIIPFRKNWKFFWLQLNASRHNDSSYLQRCLVFLLQRSVNPGIIKQRSSARYTSMSLRIKRNAIAASMKVGMQTVWRNESLIGSKSWGRKWVSIARDDTTIIQESQDAIISVMEGFFVDQNDLKSPDSLIPNPATYSRRHHWWSY